MFQIIQDHTNSHGILVWENASDRVEVIANKEIDKFEAAREIKTRGKNYKASPGEAFVPEVRLLHGEWPTFEEYIKQQAGTIE